MGKENTIKGEKIKPPDKIDAGSINQKDSRCTQSSPAAGSTHHAHACSIVSKCLGGRVHCGAAEAPRCR